jgi:serine carboxypeptidase-like clade 4
VTGESYAGHYVPAVTGRLHRALKKKEGVPINLKGFAIGNGMTQPDIQYEAYADYALDMGLISESDHTKLSKLYPACVKAAKICEKRGSISCLAAYIICDSIFSSILTITGNINVSSLELAYVQGSLRISILIQKIIFQVIFMINLWSGMV